jgi:WD40 repeat protein
VYGCVDGTLARREISRLASSRRGKPNDLVGLDSARVFYEHQILASCSYDDTIRIWIDDPQGDWDCVAILRGHTSTVWSVSFSPDGNYIASGSDDMTVRVWKRVQQYKWECVQVLEGYHERTIFSVAWGEGEPGSLGWIASTSGDGQIVIYQANVSSSALVESLMSQR